MAGNGYVTKGYSTYTNIPAQRGRYDHEPNNHVNWYVVETTTVERIRTPGHTNFGGSPAKIELLKELVHSPNMLTRPRYTPNGHHEGYEPSYGSDYENSSPPRRYGREDLMDNFINKLQIEPSQPRKTGNFSNPNKYHPSSPNRYRASSPNRHHPSSPNKYRHSSPIHSYASEEIHPIRTGNFSSPNKYHPSSPGSERAHHVRAGNFSSPNNSWQNAGPPKTSHPLTTPTNDINEALGFLEESVNYSPHPDQKKKEALNNFSTREHESRYAKPAFGKGNMTIEPYYSIPRSGNTIDSKEAMEKYGGTRV